MVDEGQVSDPYQAGIDWLDRLTLVEYFGTRELSEKLIGIRACTISGHLDDRKRCYGERKSDLEDLED